jgi:hypothetical protein
MADVTTLTWHGQDAKETKWQRSVLEEKAREVQCEKKKKDIKKPITINKNTNSPSQVVNTVSHIHCLLPYFLHKKSCLIGFVLFVFFFLFQHNNIQFINSNNNVQFTFINIHHQPPNHKTEKQYNGRPSMPSHQHKKFGVVAKT